MCCTGLLKTLMFIVNGTIFVAGAVILGVGIWVAVDSDSLMEFLHVENSEVDFSDLSTVSYVVIAIGACLFLIGFLGCCGAVTENRCMLLTFFCLVLVIFLAQVAAAIVLFVFQPVVDELLDKELRDRIKQDYGEDEALTNFWDNTMAQLHCCGVSNYTDFDNSPFNANGSYPIACCYGGYQNGSCTLNVAEALDIGGCGAKLVEVIKDSALIIAGVAIGIAFIEIAAMVVSMILYRRAGK
ncbi:uncharacterized protein V6R79_011173 [Siganus canaliculatus]